MNGTGFDRIVIGTVDMGAFETQSIVVTSANDQLDALRRV